MYVFNLRCRGLHVLVSFMELHHHWPTKASLPFISIHIPSPFLLLCLCMPRPWQKHRAQRMLSKCSWVQEMGDKLIVNPM